MTTEPSTEDRVLAALRGVETVQPKRTLQGYKFVTGNDTDRIYDLVRANVNNDGGPELTHVQVVIAMNALKQRKLITPGDISGTFWVRTV